MPKTILVADDDGEFLSLLEGALKQRGYQVVSAADGEEALKKTRLLKPDMVILDVQMPKMDGDEAAMLLKGDPSTKHIPVLFVTGLRTAEEEAEIDETDVLAKPIHLEELLERVKTMVGDP